MSEESEQNKTEEATPFKLKRAREQGAVARGVDVGFFAALVALTIFAFLAGKASIFAAALAMRNLLSGLPALSLEPHLTLAAMERIVWPLAQPVLLLGLTVMLVVTLFEIVQLRGLFFTSHPLKPDFARLNPAKGLKRVFSARMLKETLKSLLKIAGYACAAVLIVREAFEQRAHSIADAAGLSQSFYDDGLRLLMAFALLALVFAAIDQVLARSEFSKQMRMSRSELTREHKEREGDPRIKQKRKQLHAQFAKQSRAIAGLVGSDMLIVNPEHFAVALAYDSATMSAPKITAKGRNLFALQLKQRAAHLSITIFQHPQLARALYRKCEHGDEAPPEEYRAIADLYLKLSQSRADGGALADRA